ncbi:transposase [Calditrichota bacterium LG25]
MNILKRFHKMKKFNEVIDTIQREGYRLNYQSLKYLKHSRWLLLKREENLISKQFLN